MAVTIDQIRRVLGNPAENTIPDDVIAQAIRDAERFVSERSGISSGSTFDMAVRYRAAYMTLLAYYDTMVRAVGPGAALDRLADRLKSLYEEAMRVLGVESYLAAEIPIAYVSVTDSWWDDQWM